MLDAVTARDLTYNIGILHNDDAHLPCHHASSLWSRRRGDA